MGFAHLGAAAGTVKKVVVIACSQDRVSLVKASEGKLGGGRDWYVLARGKEGVCGSRLAKLRVCEYHHAHQDSRAGRLEGVFPRYLG